MSEQWHSRASLCLGEVFLSTIGVLAKAILILLGLAALAFWFEIPLRWPTPTAGESLPKQEKPLPSQPPWRDQIENRIKRGLEEQTQLKVKSVSLMRQSANQYTGFAETDVGQVPVEVTVENDKLAWRVPK